MSVCVLFNQSRLQSQQLQVVVHGLIHSFRVASASREATTTSPKTLNSSHDAAFSAFKLLFFSLPVLSSLWTALKNFLLHLQNLNPPRERSKSVTPLAHTATQIRNVLSSEILAHDNADYYSTLSNCWLINLASSIHSFGLWRAAITKLLVTCRSRFDFCEARTFSIR